MSASFLQRLQARIYGQVQGVFFRAWTRDQARELNLQGWVRNCPDGSVELNAEGPEIALKALLDRCWKGPPSAHVEAIDAEWKEARGDLGDFEILH